MPRMVKIHGESCTWLRDEPNGTQIYQVGTKYYQVTIDMVGGKHQITEIPKPVGI